MREETCPNLQGWDRLGLVLLKLDESKQAEEVYQILLQQETDESKTGWLYCRLGECEEAIRFFEKSIEFYEKYSPNDPNLAHPYNNIGIIYDDMREYPKALSYYEKDLEISQQSLPSNHPGLAASYNNIGLVYEKMKNYSKAYSYYEKAVMIGEQSLHSNDSDLPRWKNNLRKMKDKL